MGTFTFFYFFGFTLNTMTLMALSLSIGTASRMGLSEGVCNHFNGLLKEALNIGMRGGLQAAPTLLCQPFSEFIQIATVAFECVARKAVFQPEGVAEFVQKVGIAHIT